MQLFSVCIKTVLTAILFFILSSGYAYFENELNVQNLSAHSKKSTKEFEGLISDSATALRPLSTISIQFTVTNVRCNGAATGSIAAEAFGANPPFTFRWNTGATTSTISNLRAGSYTLVVKNTTGDSAVATATVTEPDSIFLMVGADTVTCNGGNDGSAFAEVGGGTGPLRFLWSNGQTTPNVSNLTAGTYTFTVTDANNCTKTASVVVREPGPIAITPSITPLSCFSTCTAAISVSASNGNSPFTYSWNTGAQTQNISSLCAGSYTVTVRDNIGCTRAQSFTIANPVPPIVNLGPDRTICSGQNTTLNGTITGSGNSYQWTSTNGFTSGQAVVNVSQVGTYFLRVTTVGGCISRDTIVIASSNTPISSDFVIATQVFANRLITVVNIAEPKPDSIAWLLPASNSITVMNRTSSVLEFMIRDTGVYTIGMRANRGVCQSITNKTIKVLQPQAFDTSQRVQDPLIRNFTASPVPNNGQFTVKVNLKEISNVRLRLINIVSNLTVNDRLLTGAKDYTVNYGLSLPAGIYVLLLETAKASRVIRIVIN